MSAYEEQDKPTSPSENASQPHPYDDPMERMRGQLLEAKWKIEYCLAQVEKMQDGVG